MFLATLAGQWAERPEGAQWLLSDHEILSRIHVTGTVDLGFLRFRYWETPNLKHGVYDQRASWLGIRENPAAGEYQPQYGADGQPQYYLKGHIPNEFAVLLTLFSRQHFVYRRVLKSSGLPFMHYFSHAEPARGPFDGRNLALTPFNALFERAIVFGQTDSARASRLMLAAKFYHLALPHVDDDHDLAYLFLTSAIEPLLQNYNPQNIKLEDVNHALATFLQARLNEADAAEAERIALRPLPRIRARFVRFITDHLREAFWADPTRPEYKLERHELPEMLSRIYHARSRLLHDGRPLPPQHHFDSERAIGLAAMAGNQRWERDELLPHARTYERIVHHTLMGYFERHAPPAPSPPGVG